MTMSSIFAKPIDRPIEGVIKADDETALYMEVDEYVLIDEVARLYAVWQTATATVSRRVCAD